MYFWSDFVSLEKLRAQKVSRKTALHYSGGEEGIIALQRRREKVGLYSRGEETKTAPLTSEGVRRATGRLSTESRGKLLRCIYRLQVWMNLWGCW